MAKFTCPDCGYRGEEEELWGSENPFDSCHGEWCPKCGSGSWEYDWEREERIKYVRVYD
jgi:Zn finger protein HypA/HybF involved in hydrogenase expression